MVLHLDFMSAKWLSFLGRRLCDVRSIDCKRLNTKGGIMSSSPKDGWDKFSLVTSFLSTVILIAIPIVLGVGAQKISSSLERGKTVEGMIDKLVASNPQLNRDIALAALAEAINPKEKCFIWILLCSSDETIYDPVAEIAELMMRDGVQLNAKANVVLESLYAAKILKLRKPKSAQNILESITKNVKAVTESNSVMNLSNPKIKIETTTLSRIQATKVVKDLAEVFADSSTSLTKSLKLNDVKVVYIQYKLSTKKAEKLQDFFKSVNILSPGIQSIENISQNDIRYPNPSYFETAKNLQKEISQILGIVENEIKLIDLSKVYKNKIPDGQFEIWLNL